MIKSAVALNMVIAIQDWTPDTVAVTINDHHVLSFTGVTASQLDINLVAPHIAEMSGFLKHPRIIPKVAAHPTLLRKGA